MTLPSEASAISPGRSDRPAANPPAESTENIVLDCIDRAHNKGHAALMNIAIARDCPSLRSIYFALAAEQLARAADELAGAIAAQARREAAGEADSNSSAPAAPSPSIRCNDCYAPADCDCAECRTRNTERDARFDAPESHP